MPETVAELRKKLHAWRANVDAKMMKPNPGKIKMSASLGEGCSPVVHDGKIVIVRDHSRQSSIEVLSAKNGKPLWKVERHEKNVIELPKLVQSFR